MNNPDAPSIKDMKVPRIEFDVSLPDIMVSSSHPLDGLGWSDAAQKVARHALVLSMQSYALSWIEMFDENPDLESVEVSASSDGFLMLHKVVGMSEEDLSGEMEKINDGRSDAILYFISKMTDEGITRENLHDVIEEAYNENLPESEFPGWSEVSAKRKALIEAWRMEKDTPAAPNSKRSGPGRL